MKRFIFKIGMFILIIFSILGILNYRWVNSEVYSVVGETYRMENIPSDIEIMNLGSSHAQFAFDYSRLDAHTGFNFAVPAQSFMYDLNMLKQYKNYLADDCVVIIPVSYFDYYEDYEKESIKVRERRFYYPILKCNLIEEFNIEDAIKHKFLPILSIKSDQLKYILDDDQLAIERYEDQYLENKFIASDGEIDMEYFMEYNEINVHDHSLNFDKGINEYGLDRLHEIIEFCIDEGYKPMLVTTPFSSYYNEAEDFNTGFYEEFAALTNSIANEYSIDYWDYSHDARFQDDLTLFYDNNHLNKGRGMAMFSDIFFERLSEEGYLD